MITAPEQEAPKASGGQLWLPGGNYGIRSNTSIWTRHRTLFLIFSFALLAYLIGNSIHMYSQISTMIELREQAISEQLSSGSSAISWSELIDTGLVSTLMFLGLVGLFCLSSIIFCKVAFHPMIIAAFIFSVFLVIYTFVAVSALVLNEQTTESEILSRIPGVTIVSSEVSPANFWDGSREMTFTVSDENGDFHIIEGDLKSGVTTINIPPALLEDSGEK